MWIYDSYKIFYKYLGLPKCFIFDNQQYTMEKNGLPLKTASYFETVSSFNNLLFVFIVTKDCIAAILYQTSSYNKLWPWFNILL